MDVLTSDQFAELIGVSNFTVRLWRIEGKGPPFIKLNSGKRAPVRYARADVDAWLREQTFANTSQYADRKPCQSENSK